MFGFVVASVTSLSDEEKVRYQAVYCGLCRRLAARYNQVSRLALTYDLTFFVLLCDSLHEPPETTGEEPCVMHPLKAMRYAESPWTDYAADLSVALAYHKCLDDVADDNSLRGRTGAAALKSAYQVCCGRIPQQCDAIERAMEEIRVIENTPEAPPDGAAHAFGALTRELFRWNQGYWEDTMAHLGDVLGQFIYLMDAACDYEDDAKRGSYNPFVALKSTPEEMREVLELTAAETSTWFERLPLEQDLHLLRSVLYEGVWIQFNRGYFYK
jgi:hypothetical protein